MNAKYTKLIQLYLPGTRATRRKRFPERLTQWQGKCRVDTRLQIGDAFLWNGDTWILCGTKTAELLTQGITLFTSHHGTPHKENDDYA